MRSRRSNGVLPMRSRRFCPIRPDVPATAVEKVCLFTAFIFMWPPNSIQTIGCENAPVYSRILKSLAEIKPAFRSGSHRARPIFCFTQPVLTQYSGQHVVHQQTLQPSSGGIFGR